MVRSTDEQQNHFTTESPVGPNFGAPTLLVDFGFGFLLFPSMLAKSAPTQAELQMEAIPTAKFR